ncbi:hypothetical protein B0O99DRAFT_267283 [Bisporella sp. PMI_857]|nr:hypothetical protein B0O99DRAFT_267283 [Bisporella sp. PMI_857]
MLDEKKANRIRIQLQLSILDSLRSNTMHERHDAIVDAHQRTFQWILSSTKEGGQHGFSEWLKMGSGLYWIQGKAGSGKSTLMKFVVDDPRTSEYLRQWAGGSAFEFCAFYFWRYGAPEQRSQHGLLQSILYSILKQRPDLIEIACSETWNYKYTMCTNDIPLKSDDPWMLGDLKKAFKRVMEQASSNTKFCIFIDGLDEYDGDYAEIASYFSQLSSSPFIKICISGRPLPVFGYAFRDMPTLKLQNLTAEDIRQFVVAKFTSNDRAWSFLKTESSDANRLIDKIVHKADGVFLWVNLAVNSLLRGLDNNDDISVLERRLGDLPQELERLYSHMLASIEAIYMEEASMAFQIYEACWYCRSAAIINQAWEEARFSPSGKTATKDTAKTLFQTRCGGLIDVDVEAAHTDVYLWKYRPTASYIHETVGTYVSSPTIWQHLLSYTSQLDFDPNIALIKGATVRLTWACNSEPRNVLEWIVFYWNVVSAAAIDIDENSSIANAASDALNEFDYVAHSLAKEWRTRAFAPH